MFQFTWFDRKQYQANKEIVQLQVLPGNYLTEKDIDTVRTLYWEEHCLECSPPDCYENCNHWRKRRDGSCVRLHYGIRGAPALPGTLWCAEMKFRPWGKLESRINQGGVTCREIKKLSVWDVGYTGLFKTVSQLTNFVYSDYKFSRLAEGIKRRKYANILPSGKMEDTFLLQCFSKEAQPFHLFLELTDPKNTTTMRRKLKIAPGFNEHIVKIDVPIIEGGLIRLYPENDCEAQLSVFTCDIVKLKKNEPPLNPAPKVKCVAWDLDNTVWDGILIESEPENLKLRANVLETMQTLDNRGIIQIAVSKNNESECLPQLRRLGIDQYFVYNFINWNPKSANISAAANALNIHVDTFALVDDSHFEREEVHSILPCVRTYNEMQVGDIPELEEFQLTVTKESRNRRKMYQTEAARKMLSESFAGDNTDFLRSCEIKISIRKPTTEEEKNRSFDLIHRTNQLNLSGRKYGKEEFEHILQDKQREHYIVECCDKFGSYGQVAFISLKCEDAVYIDEFAMSCRIANKYVESAIMKWLKEHYNKDVLLTGRRTERNSLLILAFTDIGFTDESRDTQILLRLPMEQGVDRDDIVEVEDDKSCTEDDFQQI